MDEEAKVKKRTKCQRFQNWIGTPSFYLIVNFLISQWGDWMWLFSVGIYLSELADESLILAGIFGFIGGGCVLLFGGLIGDWVDRNPRIKVVRTSLFLQNTAVALSALGVCVALIMKHKKEQFHIYQYYAIEALVVLMAVIAQLASVAYKIAIEKDWMVVITHGNSSHLTNLNAITRSLDLACKIVSPMTVGYIMTAFSKFTSAIVLAAWNIISMFVEYSLLSLIYRREPALAVKGRAEEEKEMMVMGEGANGAAKKDSENNEVTVKKSLKKEKLGFFGVVKRSLSVMVGGWKIYIRQKVVWAGLSLALLYMTVLGFDSVTVAYIAANDISDFLVGTSMGLAGLTGIIGAIMFSFMAKRIGLEKTGVFSFTAEVLCLILVVASVWAPGTKFDPYGTHTKDPSTNHTYLPNNTTFRHINSTNLTTDIAHESIRSYNFLSNLNISITLLLVGIILSRVGLWMSDLVVTQLLQENIADEERGVVNGVQNSLNMLLEMLKFFLVILLPHINIFGVHIILSFIFVCLAMLCFYWHAFKFRRSETHNNKMNEIKANGDIKEGVPLRGNEIVTNVSESPIS